MASTRVSANPGWPGPAALAVGARALDPERALGGGEAQIGRGDRHGHGGQRPIPSALSAIDTAVDRAVTPAS